jgi:hypothetical protein
MNAKNSAARKAAAIARSNAELAAGLRQQASMGERLDYRDTPRRDLIAQAMVHISAGRTVFFKLTCRGCGERMTIDLPNTICEYVRHEISDGGCGVNTRFVKGGFMVVTTPNGADELRALLDALDAA